MDRPTVVIIEDAIELAESLEDVFALHGFLVKTVRTAHAGIELALTEKPQLILLDIRLPDYSGYDVYRSIRADAWGATATIMILTATETPDVIAKKIDLPIEAILYKPTTNLQTIVMTAQQLLKGN